MCLKSKMKTMKKEKYDDYDDGCFIVVVIAVIIGAGSRMQHARVPKYSRISATTTTAITITKQKQANTKLYACVALQFSFFNRVAFMAARAGPSHVESTKSKSAFNSILF